MIKQLLYIIRDLITGNFQYRIRALLAFIVGAILIVLIRQVSLISSVRKTNEIVSEVVSIKGSLRSFGSQMEQFAALAYSDYDFVRTGESGNTQRIRQDYHWVQMQIDSLSASSILSAQSEQSLYEIRNKTERIWREYNVMLELLREKGNERGGLISDWSAAVTSLTSAYETDQTMLAKLARADQAMARYLLSHDQALISEISTLTQADAGLVADSSYFAFSDEGLGQLANLAGLIVQKDLLIGYGAESGAIPTINGLLAETLTNLGNLHTEALQLRAQFNKKALRGTIILYFLLLVSLLWTVIDLRKALLSRLKLLLSVSTGLSKGSVPAIPAQSKADELSMALSQLGRFTSDLHNKTEFARAISSGQYKVTYAPLSDDDTLGNELLALRQNLIKTSEEEKRIAVDNQKRQWSNEGMTIFADILRQNSSNLDDLCDAVIQQLVKYLKASVGGLFLVDDADKNNVMLRLKSMFAYNRRKYIDKEYALGEGLIGACAFERKILCLPKYPMITSK